MNREKAILTWTKNILFKNAEPMQTGKCFQNMEFKH